MGLIGKKDLRSVFPNVNKYTKKHLQFLYNVSYVNYLETSFDLIDFVKKINISKLYEAYLQHHCIPIVNSLVVSFVNAKFVNEFVDTQNAMYIITEDLLVNWEV